MFTDELLEKLTQFSDDISELGYWVSTRVFDQKTLELLIKSYESKQTKLEVSRFGIGQDKTINSEVRGDKNLWIDQSNQEFLATWELLNQLIAISKKELFLPLKRFEAQMSLYLPGSYYACHVDQHRSMPHRLLSVVFYLSPWKVGDGGELQIYNKDKLALSKSPRQNHMIVFKSDLKHEVLPTHIQRKSISAWLRNDIL